MSTIEERSDGYGAADALSGLLATASIVLSAIASGLGILLEIEPRPTRFTPVAIVLALLAARMSDRFRRLAVFAVSVSMIAWFWGLTLAVITDSPLF